MGCQQRHLHWTSPMLASNQVAHPPVASQHRELEETVMEKIFHTLLKLLTPCCQQCQPGPSNIHLFVHILVSSFGGFVHLTPSSHNFRFHWIPHQLSHGAAMGGCKVQYTLQNRAILYLKSFEPHFHYKISTVLDMNQYKTNME